jgi:SAM-dependent methyltransferase
MVKDRVTQTQGATGTATEGSILDPPFQDASFDFVVAIGSLHHTGNMAEAIKQCHRLLRPGGRFCFMVYNAYSYRRFVQARRETLVYWLRERLGYRGVVAGLSANHRYAYDSNSGGQAAPHTNWISRTSLRHLCRDFASFRAQLENIDQEKPFSDRKREDLLNTAWPTYFGLDIYVRAVR